MSRSNSSSDDIQSASLGGFVTICRPGRRALRPAIFLHGSSSDETSLIGLADQYARNRTCYFPRGSEPDNEAFTFFRRRADRSIDNANLESRSHELASFLAAIAEANQAAPLLIGFSSGAVTAAALLTSHPDLVAGAVLLRPEPPYGSRAFQPLAKRPILLISGDHDPRRRKSDAATLADLLKAANAEVELHNIPCAHAMEAQDIELTRAWLSRRG